MKKLNVHDYEFFSILRITYLLTYMGDGCIISALRCPLALSRCPFLVWLRAWTKPLSQTTKTPMTKLLLLLLHKIQQLSTTTVARSASLLSVTYASRCCHVATSVSVSRELTKCSVRDVVVPSAVLELTWYCDFTNVQLFWFFWTVLLICRTMDVAFCLCTVIFIFYIDHASLVFCSCMCTLIVFLIFL